MTRVMIRGMSRSRFLGESELVGRFLQVLGYRDFSLHNPNVQPGVETGSDVLVLLDSKRYGVQVTVLHTDEGLSPRQRGSEHRSQEAKFKNGTQPYAANGNPNPMPALRYRIEAKCSKSYPTNDFDEEILLVVSGLPKMGAIASTIVLPIALQVDKMNSELSPILESSRYDCAYIFRHDRERRTMGIRMGKGIRLDQAG
jgi:hypothetical protein